MFVLSGSKVRALRDERGLSQTKLANASGVTSSYISRIECKAGGSQSDVDTAVKLARALGVPVEALVSEL